MFQKLLEEAKGNRRQAIANLMKEVTERSPVYGGCEILRAPGDALSIKITKSQTDLSRFKSLSYSNRYLYLRNNNQVIPLDKMSQEP